MISDASQTSTSLDSLIAQVHKWVESWSGWSVSLSETEVEDEKGVFIAPVATLDTPKGRLILEPVGRNGDGRWVVELYAWPTLFRVRLVESDSHWKVRTDSGFYLRQDWNADNFRQLAEDLLGGEA